MRKVLLAAVALVILPLAEARADGPWCAYYSRGGTNCGFHTYAQCRASVSGVGGSCQPNPFFQGGAATRRLR